MGLFDNILGGASSSQATSTSTQTQDATAASNIIIGEPTPVTASASGVEMPVIDPMSVLNEESTSTPPNLDDILGMSAVTSDMPSYTAQKAAQAEMAASPVILSETPSMETSIPVITETPVVETVVSEMPVIETNSPVVEAPVNNITSADSLFANISSPVAATPVAMTPVAEEVTPMKVIAESSADSLFANISETPTPETPITEAKTEALEIPSVSENSLFGDIAEEAIVSNELKNPQSEVLSQEIPSNTMDFLAAGLAQLAAMKLTLANRKAEFLAQAEEYRAKKEEFAELERKALEDSTSMDDEQARIEAMEKYFEKQQKGADLNDSVNTALTGIGVKNAVGSAINKKTSRKTHNEKIAA